MSRLLLSRLQTAIHAISKLPLWDSLPTNLQDELIDLSLDVTTTKSQQDREFLIDLNALLQRIYDRNQYGSLLGIHELQTSLMNVIKEYAKQSEEQSVSINKYIIDLKTKSQSIKEITYDEDEIEEVEYIEFKRNTSAQPPQQENNLEKINVIINDESALPSADDIEIDLLGFGDDVADSEEQNFVQTHIQIAPDSDTEPSKEDLDENDFKEIEAIAAENTVVPIKFNKIRKKEIRDHIADTDTDDAARIEEYHALKQIELNEVINDINICDNNNYIIYQLYTVCLLEKLKDFATTFKSNNTSILSEESQAFLTKLENISLDENLIPELKTARIIENLQSHLSELNNLWRNALESDQSFDASIMEQIRKSIINVIKLYTDSNEPYSSTLEEFQDIYKFLESMQQRHVEKVASYKDIELFSLIKWLENNKGSGLFSHTTGIFHKLRHSGEYGIHFTPAKPLADDLYPQELSLYLEGNQLKYIAKDINKNLYEGEVPEGDNKNNLIEILQAIVKQSTEDNEVVTNFFDYITEQHPVSSVDEYNFLFMSEKANPVELENSQISLYQTDDGKLNYLIKDMEGTVHEGSVRDGDEKNKLTALLNRQISEDPFADMQTMTANDPALNNEEQQTLKNFLEFTSQQGYTPVANEYKLDFDNEKPELAELSINTIYLYSSDAQELKYIVKDKNEIIHEGNIEKPDEKITLINLLERKINEDPLTATPLFIKNPKLQPEHKQTLQEFLNFTSKERHTPISKHLSNWYAKYCAQKTVAAREVVAQEFFRLIIPYQPKTRLGKTENHLHYVLSKETKGAKSLQDIYEKHFEKRPDFIRKKLESGRYTGMGRIMVLSLFLNEVDLKLGNLMVDKQGRIFKIDGDWALARLRDSKYVNSSPITTADIQNLPLPKDYQPHNWGPTCRSGTHYENNNVFTPTLATKDFFRREINETLLHILIMPSQFLEKFIQGYITDKTEIAYLKSELVSRHAQLRFAALNDPSFQQYLQTADAKKHMQVCMESVSDFKTMRKQHLITEDKEALHEEIEYAFLNLKTEAKTKINSRVQPVPSSEAFNTEGILKGLKGQPLATIIEETTNDTEPAPVDQKKNDLVLNSPAESDKIAPANDKESDQEHPKPR